jgi:hypothetical protein
LAYMRARRASVATARVVGQGRQSKSPAFAAIPRRNSCY